MSPTLTGSFPAFNTTVNTASLVSGSFTPSNGDVLVIKAVTSDASLTFGTPSGGGLTWTSQLSSATALFCAVRIWTAPVPSSPGAMTVTLPVSGTAHTHGMVVEQWASAQLAATPATGTAQSASGTPSATIAGVTAGSVVSWVDGDWNGAVTSRTYLTTSGTPVEESYEADPHYTGYWAYQPAASGGTQTFGLSAPAGQKWTLAAIEIQALVVTHSGAAALSGSGTLTGAGVFAGAAALTGAGTLTGTATHGTGHGGGTAALTGTGTLTGTATGTFIQVAALSGTGTLTAAWTGTLVQPPATLTGSGTLQLSGVKLGFTAGLAGNGTLSVLQATGGLRFASPGAATPYAYPLSSQVMVAPPGTAAWRPLGSVGVVTALTYSFTCPGGADKMSCTVMAPATYRTQLFNPGWQVKITRGGHQVWSGKLDEPVPSPSGWTLTAVGTGNRGQDFLAVYTSTWPVSEPDEAVNAAISRGLPWTSPGIGTPAGAWFGQAVDSGAQTVSGLLNLICTRGGLAWYVNSQPGGTPGDDLTVFPLPTVVNRLLVVTDPAARTLGGDINTIYIRYQSAADDPGGTGTPAVFSTTSVQNAASVAAHQVIEVSVDLASAGTMTTAAAQAVGNNILAIYQRASFAGPFTARYGQLTNTGGVPVDPGADQAGTVVKLILGDFGYGGEVTPQFPVTFIVGAFEWDDLAQTATISPYQLVDQSLTGLLSLANTEMTPITVIG